MSIGSTRNGIFFSATETFLMFQGIGLMFGKKLCGKGFFRAPEMNQAVHRVKDSMAPLTMRKNK
jgi:hypothetical protein